MRAFRFFAVFLVLLGILSPGAMAAMLGDPKVPFSADRVLVLGDKTLSGKIFSRPGQQRHEQDIGGTRQIVLLRGDHSRGWLVLPALNSFVEFNFAPAASELADPSLLGTRLGEEKVAGLTATKYRIEHTARDGTFVEGYLWLTHDGIPAKLDGSYTQPNHKDSTRVRMELSNIRIGPQSASLFELPPGISKLSLGGIKPALGGGMGN